MMMNIFITSNHDVSRGMPWACLPTLGRRMSNLSVRSLSVLTSSHFLDLVSTLAFSAFFTQPTGSSSTSSRSHRPWCCFCSASPCHLGVSSVDLKGKAGHIHVNPVNFVKLAKIWPLGLDVRVVVAGEPTPRYTGPREGSQRLRDFAIGVCQSNLCRSWFFWAGAMLKLPSTWGDPWSEQR